MRFSTFLRYLTALTAIAAFGAQAHTADLIGYWNFNDLEISPASPPGSGGAPTTIGATQGAGTLSLTGFTGNVDDLTGTSVNSIPVNTPGGDALGLIGMAGNGSYLQLEFSMTGRSNLGVSFASQRSGTGFNSNQWSYSTDGTTFTNFGSAVAPTTNSYSLIGPIVTSALDNVATAYLRYTQSGASSATLRR